MFNHFTAERFKKQNSASNLGAAMTAAAAAQQAQQQQQEQEHCGITPFLGGMQLRPASFRSEPPSSESTPQAPTEFRLGRLPRGRLNTVRAG